MYFSRIIVVLIALSVHETQGRKTQINKNRDYMKWQISDTCDFQAYAPLSEVPIGKIKAPTASIEDTILCTTADLGTQIASVGTEAVDLIDTNLARVAKNFHKTFSKIAPALSTSLGVFGAGFGIITANTSPSASDAINAANQAIRKLTNQVNHKLELLKNYVDNEFAQHIRGSLEKQYKEMASYWALCLNEKTKEGVNDCIREAFNGLQAKESHFVIYLTEMKSNQKLSIKETLRLEATMDIFRNYVFLNLLELTTLIETFKDDTHYLPIFKRTMHTNVDRYAKYSTWAVDLIIDAHLNHGKDRSGACQETFKCEAVTTNKGSLAFFQVDTSKSTTCSCKIDPLNPVKCSVDIEVYIRDGDYGTIDTKIWKEVPELIGTHYEKQVSNMKDRANLILRYGKAPFYVQRLEAGLKTYWKKSILVSVERWRKFKPKMSGDEYETMSRLANNYVGFGQKKEENYSI